MTALIFAAVFCYLVFPQVLALADFIRGLNDPRPAVTDLVRASSENIIGKVESSFADVSSLSKAAIVTSVADVCKSVATCIVIFNFAIKLVQVFSRESMSQDVWMRILMQYILIALVCVYCDKIIDIFDEIGSVLYTSIKGKLALSSLGASDSEITQQVDDLLAIIEQQYGVIDILGLRMTCTMLKFAFWVAGICISIQCYSIGIELAIRKALLPLAVADMSGEGERSGGFRYLKQYAATWLRMASVLIMCSLLATLSANITLSSGDQFVGFFFKQIIVAFTAVGMTAKLNEVANGALGA